jgi:hypothetical protein
MTHAGGRKRNRVPRWVTRSLRKEWVDFANEENVAVANRRIQELQAETPKEVLDADNAWTRPDDILPVATASASARLFPGNVAPDQAWAADKITDAPLPIDIWLNGGRGSKLLLPEYQQRLMGDLCFEARRWILLAVMQSNKALGIEGRISDNDNYIERKHAQLFGEIRSKKGKIKSISLFDQLETYVADLNPVAVLPFVHRTGAVGFGLANEEFNEASQIIDRLKSALRDAARLDDLFMKHQKRVPAIKSKRAKPWAIYFAETLGYLWLRWTGDGRDPRTSGFVKFVEACYDSATLNIQNLSFTYAARQGLSLLSRKAIKPIAIATKRGKQRRG